MVDRVLLILIIVAVAGTPLKASMIDGLTAYWSFDEGTGTSAHDQAVAGSFDDTLGFIGSPTWTAGKFGQAVAFDQVGALDCLIADNSPDLMPSSGQLSISLWTRLCVPVSQQTSQYNLVTLLSTGEANGYWLSFNEPYSSGLIFRVCGGHAADAVWSAANLAVDVWHHIVATYDGATVSLYVNGDLKATAPRSWLGVTSSPLRIGKNLQGVVDDVGIWNRALSAEEIGAICQCTGPLDPAPEPSALFLLIIGGLVMLRPGRRAQQRRC